MPTYARILMNAFKQCSMRKHDVGNRTIFVMDGLFEEQFIRMIHHFMSHLPSTLSDYDTEQTRHARHWKHEFDLRKLPSMPLIGELISQTVAVSSEMYASLNL